MKFLRATEHERHYALRPSELQMLLLVLGSFPVWQRSQPLSKAGDEAGLAEAQKLLDEAMNERWHTMRRELEEWMQTPDRFRQAGPHLVWRVEHDRREWLLQVFNNVRVGSWIELGSPDHPEAAHQQTDARSVHHLTLMELAGLFQTALLEEPGG